jgi:PAS domain S-box-containing protein
MGLGQLDLETRGRVFDELGDMFLVVGTESGRLLDTNETMCRTLQYDRGELLGRPVTEITGFGSIDAWRSHIPAETESHLGENVLYRADGGEVPIEANVSRGSFDGQPAVLVVARDISERKRQTRELERQKARAEQFFEMAGNIMLVLDLEGRVERINERGSDLLGYEHGELRGSDWLETVIPGAAAPEVRSTFRKLSTGEATDIEDYTNVVETKAGNRRHIKWNNTVIRDESGEITNVLATGFDVTDQKRYEQQLEEQRDNLDVLNQVLRHDIRNDLQVVTAYTELLAEQVEDGQEYIETVRERADHAVELTTTAREMADVMLSKDAVQRRVDLRSTLESELDEIRSTYPVAVVTVEESLPAVKVLANDMLDSVFRNLLKNAIQHNDAAVPEVSVSATVDGETARVRVADNGPGIPDERKSGLFEKGEKSTDSEGAGLGLHLVETLVESYGGSVRVEDNDPEGAVFVVELPTAGE